MNHKIRIVSLLAAGVVLGSGSGVIAKTTMAHHYWANHAAVTGLGDRTGTFLKRTIADEDPKPEDPKPETPATDQPAPDAPAGDNMTGEVNAAPEAATGTIEIQGKDEKVVETVGDGTVQAVVSDNDGKKLDVVDVGADGAIKATPYEDGAAKPPVDEGNINTVDETKIEADATAGTGAAAGTDVAAPENPVAPTVAGVEVKALLSTLPAVADIDQDVKTSVQTELSEPTDETGKTPLEVDASTDDAGTVTAQAFVGVDRKPEGEMVMSALTPNPDATDTDHPMTREITYKDFSGAHYNGKVVESVNPKTGDFKLTTDNLTSNLNGADQAYAFTLTGDKKGKAKAARTANSHSGTTSIQHLATGTPPPPDPRPEPVFVQHHNTPGPLPTASLHISSTNFQITEHPQSNSHDAEHAQPQPLAPRPPYHATVHLVIPLAQHHNQPR